jgi:hypothetical protein
MPKILLTLAAAFMVVLAGMSLSFEAKAADTNKPRANLDRIATASPNCRDLWRCGPAGCNLHHVCARPCPDGYSCSPLYGAYGPYGGDAYWASYTYGGWGSGR